MKFLLIPNHVNFTYGLSNSEKSSNWSLNQTIFLFDAKVFNLTFLKGKILIRVI
jgi:hypothetical protein